jgi:HPt (histidine-containing phosphotransfer) domain-containing protein
MINPIQIEELLERVSGNKEFIIQMLDLFFQSSDERLSSLGKEFDNRNYSELANQTHKLKGLVSNLSINKALPILKELNEAAKQENDLLIVSLLKDLDATISEARTFYQKNPTLKP